MLIGLGQIEASDTLDTSTLGPIAFGLMIAFFALSSLGRGAGYHKERRKAIREAEETVRRKHPRHYQRVGRAFKAARAAF